MENKTNSWRNWFSRKFLLFTGGTSVFVFGFMLFYYFSKKKKNDKELSGSFLKEIPDELLAKIVKKIKSQVILLCAKKYDLSQDYHTTDFYQFVSQNPELENLVFDSKFKSEIEKRNLQSAEEKEKFKKEFIFNKLKSISAKNEIHKTMVVNFTPDLLLKYEIEIVNHYGYNSDEYLQAIKKLAKKK